MNESTSYILTDDKWVVETGLLSSEQLENA